jgi:hypothetical protein
MVKKPGIDRRRKVRLGRGRRQFARLVGEAGRYWTIHGRQGTIDIQRWRPLRNGGKKTSVRDRKIIVEPSDSQVGKWLDCIRTRKHPNASIEVGHQHAISTIIAAATSMLQMIGRARVDSFV